MHRLAVTLIVFLAAAPAQDPLTGLSALDRMSRCCHDCARGAWLARILWLVEHYPDSGFFRTQYALSVPPPGTGAADDNQLYARLAAAWLRQVDRNPARQVIDNAFRAVVQSDFDAAENLLMRARQLDPAYPDWTQLLADLYVSAIDPSWRQLQMARPEIVTPEIAGRVQRQLETSRDAALLQEAGRVLSVPDSPELLQAFGPSLGGPGFGQRLLDRARLLDPAGFERRKGGSPQRIRVGGMTIAAKLLCMADPVCPAEARKARIQGKVVFSVLIRINGSVADLRVISGDPLFVPAAREAIRKRRYTPAVLNGEPITVVSQIPVDFILSKPPRNPTQPPPESAPIRLEAGALESLLIKRVAPVRCWECRRISGIVRFNVRIGRDGTVLHIQLVSGHPLLVPAAMDAVRQWVYRPTEVNGTAVEVEGQVDVQFPPRD